MIRIAIRSRPTSRLRVRLTIFAGSWSYAQFARHFEVHICIGRKTAVPPFMFAHYRYDKQLSFCLRPPLPAEWIVQLRGMYRALRSPIAFRWERAS